MKILYTAKAKAVGGRDGFAETDDGALKVELSIPKQLGGPGKPGATNPEQLFATGYAACFESAIRYVARSEKIAITELSVTAEVSLIPATVGFALVVSLHPVFGNLEQDVCTRLVEKAHQVCPYSNAIRNNVQVTIQIN